MPSSPASRFRALLTEIGNASSGDEAICLAAGRRLVGLGGDLTVLQRVDLGPSFQRAGIPATFEDLALEGGFDEATTVEELVELLAARFPDAHQRLQGLTAAHDLVFVAPGGKFTDGLDNPRALACACVALARGKAVVILHQSVGPIERATHRRLLVDVFSRCELILVRDAQSLRFLRELGLDPTRLVRAADAVFGEDWGPASRADLDLGLNLRTSPLGHLDLAAVRHFLDRCRRERPERRILIFSTSIPVSAPLRSLGEELGYEVVGEMPSFPDVLRVVSRCRLHASDSYHGVLFSMLAGRPVACCQTDLRTWKLQGMVGPDGQHLRVLRGLDGREGADELFSEIDRLERESDGILRRQQTLVEEERRRVELGWKRVADLIDSRVEPIATAKVAAPWHRDKEAILLIDRPRDEEHDRIRCTARLELAGDEVQELWFTVPARSRSWLTDRADPFLLAALFSVVETRRATRLRIEAAPTSSSLLSNLDDLQRVWRAWWDLGTCEIVATTAPSSAPTSGPAIAGFSGGIDSTFTVARNSRSGGRWHGELAAGLMVHGFDIPLEQGEGFRRAAERSGRILRNLNTELVVASSNIREIFRDWRIAHGAALAAALTLFGGRFTTGLIAASATCELPLVPWGSTALTDELLGGREFRIVHDGAAWSRLDKVRFLADWPSVLTESRFCWQNDPPEGNCGRCAKCILTFLEMQVVGVEAQCFTDPPTSSDVLDLFASYPSDPFGDPAFRDVLALATNQGRSDPWVPALRRALART